MGHRSSDHRAGRAAALIRPKLAIFTAPPFLAALALLLLNDFYFKAHYGNWLTGKLSDFAGLVVVSLAALPFFANRAKTALGVIGGAFVLWKSPLSQPLIDFVNAHSAVRFARVVDYTDLLALLVLPISARWFRAYGAGARAETFVHKAARWPMIAITVLAVTATSAPVPYWQGFAVHRASQPVAPTESAGEIAVAALERQGFDCDVLFFCTRDDLHAAVCYRDGQAWVIVEGPLDKGFPLRYTGERTVAAIDEIAEQLRAELAPQLDVVAYGKSTHWDGSQEPALAICLYRER